MANRFKVKGVSILELTHDTTDSIAEATASAKDAGIDNIRYQQMDVTDLSSLESDSFDLIHAHQVMLHLKDPVLTLKQLRRIVKPRGIIGIRDNFSLYWLEATPAMQHLLDNRDKLMMHPSGGRTNHIWMHEAGFPYEDITTGSAAWEFSGPEGRKVWVQGGKDSSRAVGLKVGFEDNAFYDQLVKDWEEWEKNEKGRVVGLDSWVVATKS